MTVLYGNDVSSILVLSTKKPHPSYLKKLFVFQKICFKVKKIENVQKFHRLSHKNIPKKIQEIIFRRTDALSVGFKMKPLKKEFSIVRIKTNSNFAVKPFAFTVYLMDHLF